MCNPNPVDCDLVCQKNKPTYEVRRSPSTGELEFTNSVDSTKVTLRDEVGVGDFDYLKHRCEVMWNCLKSGIFLSMPGIPGNTEVFHRNLEKSLNFVFAVYLVQFLRLAYGRRI